MEALPTLSVNGWMTDKNIIMTKLYIYYLTTLKSQTTVFKDYNVSFFYTLKEYGNDHDQLMLNVKEDLNKLYTKYFTSVKVDASIDETTYNNKTVYLLKINITATDDDGNEYTLIKSIDMSNLNPDLTPDQYIDYVIKEGV